MQLDALAFGAHVDDIELSCSGTLIKLARAGYRIGACELTRGELSTRGTPEIRAAEAEEAARIMGLAVRENLGIPDGGIEVTAANRLKVIELIRRLRPEYVILPYWQCRHYDHVHASRLVSEAGFYSGLRKIDTGQEPHRPRLLLYYFMRHEGEPSFVVDISETAEAKRRAILAHSSQFYDPQSTEPETFISSKEFLEAIFDRNRYWGMRVGVAYGEPFLIRETIRLDDPLAALKNLDPGRIMSTRSR